MRAGYCSPVSFPAQRPLQWLSSVSVLAREERQRVFDVEVDGRGGEQEAVHAVEQATVARQELARVLCACVSACVCVCVCACMCITASTRRSTRSAHLVVFSDDALEGREVEAHRVEAAPQRPHVRPFVDLRVAGRVPQLRRAVRHRTVLRCVLLQQQGLCARVDLDSRKFGGAEVHEHRHISRAEQHVRRLDVAVCPDGCVCVELLQSSQNPREDAQRLYLGQVLAALEQQADSIVQRASVERHEQPELSRLVLRRDEAVVDERHQVGVREGIVHTYFPFGGLHRVRVCC
mmetsp:Transcript_8599/g.20122  ORF Transcript_8599/g.20122 Transcript_8599/m.20122 type:complete len:291 (-) Transcript_8599:452-1324(-)